MEPLILEGSPLAHYLEGKPFLSSRLFGGSECSDYPPGEGEGQGSVIAVEATSLQDSIREGEGSGFAPSTKPGLSNKLRKRPPKPLILQTVLPKNAIYIQTQ